MLFITNRFPTQSIKCRVGRVFDFGVKNNAASNSVFYCRRLGKGKYEEIGGSNLMSELKSSPYRQLLVYLHGFSNLPEAVFDGAAELQALCDKGKQKELLVLPVVWPCDDDQGIVKDYLDDQKAADASAFFPGPGAGALHEMARRRPAQPDRRSVPEAHQHAGALDGQSRAARDAVCLAQVRPAKRRAAAVSKHLPGGGGYRERIGAQGARRSTHRAMWWCLTPRTTWRCVQARWRT